MKHRVKKVLAMTLSLAMFVGAIPMNTFAAFDYNHNEAESSDGYYDIISKTDWDIAPGITETEIVLNNDAGDRRQVVHMMEADISNEYTRVISSYTNMDTSKYAISTIPEQAAYIENEWGENVVGAMNTCLSWYNSAEYAKDPSRVNEPLGFMMVDSEIYFDHSVGFPTVVVIHKDVNDAGEARPESIKKVEMRTVKSKEDLNGWEDQVIPVSNGYIVKDGKNMQKPAHDNNTAARSVVGIKEDGSIVIMMNDGRQAPYSLGMNMYECAEAMIAAGCVYAANCDGGGSSTFMSQRPGEDLEVNCSPADGALRQNTHGIMFISTAPATGEFANAYLDTEADYYVPNSKVTVSALGRDFSGAEAEIPEDVTWSLDDESFGRIEDGLFTSNGTVGDVTIQLNYNGEVVGSKKIHIVNPEQVSFKEKSTVIPYGKSTDLDISATYGEFEVAFTDDDFTWKISDETAGVRDGLKYTATTDASKAGVVITATYKHADLGSTSINISFGEGSEVVWNFEDGDISKWLGTADARAWLKENNIKESAHLFEGGNFSPENASTTFLASRENGGHVKNGEYALGVELDYTHSRFSEWSYNMFFNVEGPTVLRDVANGKNATRFGMWVYIPEELWVGKDLSGIAMQTQLYGGKSAETAGSFQAHMTLSTSTKRLNALKDGDIPEDRWVYCYIDLTGHDYVSLQDPTKQTWREPSFIRFYTQHYTPKNLTFYFDDMTLDYSSAVEDREAPVISNLTVNTSGTNIRSFNANIAEHKASNASGLKYNSAKILVDGVELPNVVASGSTMSSKDVSLTGGKHTVTFVIEDNLGNTIKESKEFTVDGTSPVTLSGHNDNGTTPEYDSVYYSDINVDNVSKVDSVTATIKLNTANTWEAENVIVAEGFDMEYDHNEHDNTVTVVLTKNKDCKLTGKQTLASIPLRVWSWDVEESGITEEAAFATGLCPIVTIDTRILRGSVTFAKGYNDGYIGTFGGTLSVDTMINDVDNPWHNHEEKTINDKAATCDISGYTDRTYCEDCGSVIEWGESIPAKGHEWKVVDNKLTCANGGELFNGVYTDGKYYIEGAVVSDGWFEVNGVKTYYYKDGVKLTGSHFIDDVMCTFDENGTYNPKYKYDGWYEVDNTVMYFIANKPVTGYQKLEGEFYSFDDNGMAWDGEYIISGIKCNFDNGLLVPDDNVLIAGICGEDARYVLTKSGDLKIEGTGTIMDFKSIGNVPWSSYRYEVYSIEIGAGITEVGIRGFYGMLRVKTVTFAEGSKLNNIDDLSFARCSELESINLPITLKRIGAESFLDCNSLKTVTIPSGINYIAGGTFKGSNNLVFEVVEGSYAHTYALKNGIKVKLQKPEDISGKFGAVKWTLDTNGVLTISGSGAMEEVKNGEAPWYGYSSLIKKIIIGKEITSVGKFNFYGLKNTTEVVFEEGSKLETIGWGAFGFCSSLVEITIPATVETVDGYAFYYCEKLETVDFAESSELATIGQYAFWNCPSIKNFYVPDKLLSIGENAFLGCKETATFNVAEGTYGHEYFKNNKVTTREPLPYTVATGDCGETKWELDSLGVLTISGSGKMADNKSSASPWQKYSKLIKKVVVKKDVTYIGSFNFYKLVNVTEVVFEEGSKLETIGWGAFGFCSSLVKITIPATVETVDGYAFYYCEKLEIVDFAESSELATIGQYAFWNCPSIKNFYVPDKLLSIGENAFLGCKETATFNVAEGTYGHEYFKNNKVTTREPLPYTVATGDCGETKWELDSLGVLTISGSGKMADNKSSASPWQKYSKLIKKVVVKKDVTYIGSFNFYKLVNVTEVVFEEGSKLETIGWGAFGFCSSLVKITIPATVETVDGYAFYYCEKLEIVDFAESSELTTIGQYAFWNDKCLVEINYPDNTKIGEGAFLNCTNLIK